MLTTLAALAAASSNSTVADALQWLESQGISMKDSSSDMALFQNALESGQTMSLTEAGKMALNLVKDQHIQSSSSSATTNTTTNTKNSKVITIVADSAQLPQIISSTQATPIVVVSGSGLTGHDTSESQSTSAGHNRFMTRKSPNTLKITSSKTLTTNSKMTNLVKTPVKHVLISNSNSNLANQVNMDYIIRDRDKITLELKATKQQLEECKNKLLEKDKELNKYKLLVEELRAIQS